MRRFTLAIAGPGVNLVIAGLLWLILNATGQPFDLSKFGDAKDITEVPFLWGLFYANLILPIFNLIPAFPMDGGRALRAFLSMFVGRLNATRVAALIGQAIRDNSTVAAPLPGPVENRRLSNAA